MDFGFDASVPALGSGSANESAFGAGTLVNGLFGLADKTIPAYLQYRAAETLSKAKGPLPSSLGPLGALGASGNLLPILIIGAVALLLLRD